MNARAVSFGAVLAIGAYVSFTFARNLGSPLDADSYRRVWKAGVLALVISVLTDAAADLGAMFSVLVVLGFVFRRAAAGQPFLAPPPPTRAAAGAAPSIPALPPTNAGRRPVNRNVPPTSLVCPGGVRHFNEARGAWECSPA